MKKPTPATLNGGATTSEVPAQWAWHHRTLLHLQERLAQAHAEHTAAALQARDKSGADLIDNAEELAERDVLWAELAVQDDMRLEVASALRRLHDGTYGRCEETGKPIAEARLRAAPWTRYSVEAAARHTAGRMAI